MKKAADWANMCLGPDMFNPFPQRAAEKTTRLTVGSSDHEDVTSNLRRSRGEKAGLVETAREIMFMTSSCASSCGFSWTSGTSDPAGM